MRPPDRTTVPVELVPDRPMVRPFRPAMLNASDFPITEVPTMASAIITYLEADVRCYHCGQTAGILRRPDGRRATVQPFRRHADGAWIMIRTLTSLRCIRCAGPLFAEEVQERCRYRPELDQSRPRPGRPRKRPDIRRQAERRADDRPGA
jgi:hypothetical protein